MLGHLHPATTLSRYFVFASELLRLYIKRSPILKPDDKVLTAALCRRPSMQTLSADQAMNSAIQLLGRKAKYAVQASPRIEPKNLEENHFYNKLIELTQSPRAGESKWASRGDGRIVRVEQRKRLSVTSDLPMLSGGWKSSRSYRHHFRKEENGSWPPCRPYPTIRRIAVFFGILRREEST